MTGTTGNEIIKSWNVNKVKHNFFKLEEKAEKESNTGKKR